MKKTMKLSIVAMLTIAMFIIYSCSTDSFTGNEHEIKVESKESLPTNFNQLFIEDEISSLNSVTSEGLCDNANSDCTGDYEDVTFLMPNGTPTYPDCYFHINMKVRYCENQVDLIYVGFGALASDSDCDQFWIDVQNPLIYEYVLEATELELIAAATIQAALINPNSPIGIPICGENPSTIVNLSRAACNKYCVRYDIKKGYIVTPLSCGEACCQSTNEVCVDLATGIVKIVEISSLVPATPCKENIVTCPHGTLFTTPCRTRCSSIGQGG